MKMIAKGFVIIRDEVKEGFQVSFEDCNWAHSIEFSGQPNSLFDSPQSVDCDGCQQTGSVSWSYRQVHCRLWIYVLEDTVSNQYVW